MPLNVVTPHPLQCREFRRLFLRFNDFWAAITGGLLQGFSRVTLFLPLSTLKGVRGGSFSWHSAVRLVGMLREILGQGQVLHSLGVK